MIHFFYVVLQRTVDLSSPLTWALRLRNEANLLVISDHHAGMSFIIIYIIIYTCSSFVLNDNNTMLHQFVIICIYTNKQTGDQHCVIVFVYIYLYIYQ